MKRIKGYLLAALSAATFGLIPLYANQAILDGFSQNLYLDPDKQLITDMGFEPKKGKLPARMLAAQQPG